MFRFCGLIILILSFSFDLKAQVSIQNEDSFLFRLNYVPKIPSALREQLEAERALADRGPFKYEGIQGRAIDERIFEEDLLSLEPLIRRLETESRRFELTSGELALAYSLSEILAEQTRAYGFYPWIREERIRFAREILNDLSFSFPAITGRFYFSAQQFLNRHGIKMDLKSMTKVLEKNFRQSEILEIQVEEKTFRLDIRSRRDLLEGRFISGHFMLASWFFSELAIFLSANFPPDAHAQIFHEVADRLRMLDHIDPQLFEVDFDGEWAAYPIEWARGSANVSAMNADAAPARFFPRDIFELADQIHSFKKAKALSGEQVTFLVDQIFSRVGAAITLGELELILEILFQKNPKALESIPDLDSFAPDEDLGLVLSLWRFLGADVRKSFHADDFGKIVGFEKEIQFINQRLAEAYELGEGIDIDWSFSAISSQPYLPKLKDPDLYWDITKATNSSGVVSLVSALRDLEIALHKDWQARGLKDVEMNYHYLEFNREFVVDFEIYDPQSRTFSIAKKLRESNVGSRLPLQWGPMAMKFSERNLPKDTTELRRELYAQLNRIYIKKMQTKVLRLWGYDFDSRYRGDMQSISASFHRDVQPLYEKIKEDRFREMKVGFSVLTVDVPADVSIESAHEDFWNIFENQIEKDVLRAAARTFKAARQEAGLDFARQRMKEDLENYIREEALKNFGELLTEAFQSETPAKMKSLPSLSGSRAEILLQFQNLYGKGNESLAAEAALVGYQNSVRSGALLSFPIYLPPASTQAALDQAGKKKQLFIVLVRSYEESDLKGLYEVQLELQDEIELDQSLQAFSEFVERLLIPAIGDLGVSNRFLGLSASEADSRQRVRDFVSRTIEPDNIEKIVRLAAEIENYQLNQEQAWDHTKWIPRHVKKRSTANSIKTGVGDR
ncbi:MAG: hypothetical protein ACO3LE_03495 [Bdellovibrionota bacterium]